MRAWLDHTGAALSRDIALVIPVNTESSGNEVVEKNPSSDPTFSSYLVKPKSKHILNSRTI